MKRLLAAVAAVLLVLVPSLAEAAPTPSGRATAADIVNYFQSISGRSIVSGQQDVSGNPNTWQQKVHDITGEWPGSYAGDFAFEQVDVNARAKVIAQVKATWAAGSIPALVWHMCPPTTGTTCHWEDASAPAIKDYHLTDAQWTEMITTGTNLNTRLKQRLDEAVPFLQDLKNSGIPVLFRPQHEMNEGWSWWGGRPGANGSRKLYQITHDYLAGKGLDNLVWVWNVKDIAGGAARVADYWPGAAYVDLATLDAWSNRQPTQEWYNAMLGIAGGKPIGLSEVGTVPTPETLTAQPRWAFFSVWISWLTDPAWNTNDAIKRTYYDPRVLNRGEITFPSGSTPGRTGAITGLAGKCLDVAAAGTANGTKVQLYACNGSGAQQWTVGSDRPVRALGKCLDVTGGGTADGTKVQLWDCIGNGHQQWTYDTGTQRLVNPETGKCLDATGQSSADGTQIQIWTCNTQTNQKWSLPA